MRKKRRSNPLETFLNLWIFFNRRRKIQLIILLLVMISSGIAEFISLATVAPFLAALNEPYKLWESSYIRNIATGFGFHGPEDLLLLASLFFGLSTIIAAVIRVINLWLNTRMAAAIGSDISNKVYRRTLLQPYLVHIGRNSSEVINAITMQVEKTVMVIELSFRTATSTIVTLGILIGLLIIAWKVALLSIIMFGTSYYLIALITKKRLKLNSYIVAESNENLIKILNEGLGAIRNVILDGTHQFYLRNYNKTDVRMRKAQYQSVFMAGIPKFIFEPIGIITLVLVTLFLTSKDTNGSELLALLGTLALGAQRLLPACQQIYHSLAEINSYEASVLKIIDLLGQPKYKTLSREKINSIKFEECIEFKNVKYIYPNTNKVVLSNINLEIKKGERIGIIGKTGSGKSTFLDILMGLLKPTSGKLLVDRRDINNLDVGFNNISWTSLISHVPQSIFIADTTFSQNIAFGKSPNTFYMEDIEEASDKAMISSFIRSTINKFDTLLGERGVRLSGGQLQRIGIARALYQRRQILILDEATSALDSETEKKIMSNLDTYTKDLTIIMVAHRISTLSNCDRIIELDNGGITIYNSNEYFKKSS